MIFLVEGWLESLIKTISTEDGKVLWEGTFRENQKKKKI